MCFLGNLDSAGKEGVVIGISIELVVAVSASTSFQDSDNPGNISTF